MRVLARRKKNGMSRAKEIDRIRPTVMKENPTMAPPSVLKESVRAAIPGLGGYAPLGLRSTRPQGDEGVTLVVVTLTEMMMCTSMGYSQGLTLEAKSTVKLCWDRSWSWQL